MRQLILMKKLALLLAIVAAACLAATAGHATSLRTWVSNTGNDSNPCSVTQPCLTFAGALANTSNGGEIDCLTPGGFGGSSGVTITISVTIDCKGASNGGITVPLGNAGVAVTAAGIVVNLIGLDINGQGNVGFGSVGVVITAPATVNVRNCKIYGFGNGGYAIALEPLASGGTVVVDNVFITNSSLGIYQTNASDVTNMTVRNSIIINNETGISVDAPTHGAGTTHAGATIEQTTLAFNSITGLTVTGAGAIALLGGSTVVNNGTGVATNSGGIIYSFMDNQIGGNGTDGTPLTAYPGGPLN